MYNIRIKRYADSGVQVSLYSTLVEKRDEEEVKKRKPRGREHEWLRKDGIGCVIWHNLPLRLKQIVCHVSKWVQSLIFRAFFLTHPFKKSVSRCVKKELELWEKKGQKITETEVMYYCFIRIVKSMQEP